MLNRGIFKKLQTYKPDSVASFSLRSKSQWRGTVIIYLSRELLRGINLPTLYPAGLMSKLERAALEEYYTWHFSMQGLPANNVTITSRELLPHVFTLTLLAPPRHKVEKGLRGEVIFCGTICPRTRRGPAIYRCNALCCPDFPAHCLSKWTDNPVCREQR